MNGRYIVIDLIGKIALCSILGTTLTFVSKMDAAKMIADICADKSLLRKEEDFLTIFCTGS